MSTIPVQNFELTDNTGETILYFERSPDYFKLRITPAASGAACFGDITLESGTAQVLLRAMVRSMRDCEEDPSASLAPVPDTKPHCGDLLLKTPAGNTVAAIRVLDTTLPTFILVISAHGLASSGGEAIYLDTDVRDLVFWAAQAIRAMGQDPMELVHD